MSANHKRNFILSLIILIGLISLFEAFQQHFYIQRFDLPGNNIVSPWELLKSHLLRWFIWTITAVYFYRKLSQKTESTLTPGQLGSILLLIIALVILDILLIAIMESALNGIGIGIEGIRNNFIFYIYQKGPIFIIAYLCLAIYTYFVHKTEVLLLKLQKLTEVKDIDSQGYEELRSKHWPEETQVLTVKIGKKVNLIPLEQIEWVQSDNYCVKIHTTELNSYTLRSSMKKMEELLPESNFLRVHRSAIVNMSCLNSLTVGSKPNLEMKSGAILEVANSRLPELRQSINEKETVISV